MGKTMHFDADMVKDSPKPRVTVNEADLYYPHLSINCVNLKFLFIKPPQDRAVDFLRIM